MLRERLSALSGYLRHLLLLPLLSSLSCIGHDEGEIAYLINVNTSPEGATVVIDGETLTERTPLEDMLRTIAAPGEVVLVFSHEGYQSLELRRPYDQLSSLGTLPLVPIPVVEVSTQSPDTTPAADVAGSGATEEPRLAGVTPLTKSAPLVSPSGSSRRAAGGAIVLKPPMPSPALPELKSATEVSHRELASSLSGGMAGTSSDAVAQEVSPGLPKVGNPSGGSSSSSSQVAPSLTRPALSTVVVPETTPQQTIRVQIRSTPASADIVINGGRPSRGQANASLRPGDTASVKITAPGYETSERRLRYDEVQHNEIISVSLLPQAVKVAPTTQPAPAPPVRPVAPAPTAPVTGSSDANSSRTSSASPYKPVEPTRPPDSVAVGSVRCDPKQCQGDSAKSCVEWAQRGTSATLVELLTLRNCLSDNKKWSQAQEVATILIGRNPPPPQLAPEFVARAEARGQLQQYKGCYLDSVRALSNTSGLNDCQRALAEYYRWWCYNLNGATSQEKQAFSTNTLAEFDRSLTNTVGSIDTNMLSLDGARCVQEVQRKYQETRKNNEAVR